MKKKIYNTGATLLNKIAVSYSSASCFGMLYEAKVPEELRKKATEAKK